MDSQLGTQLTRQPPQSSSKGISLCEYCSEGFRVLLRRLSEYGSDAYIVERPTQEAQAEQYSDTVLFLRKYAKFPPNFPQDLLAKNQKVAPKSFCRHTGRKGCDANDSQKLQMSGCLSHLRKAQCSDSWCRHGRCDPDDDLLERRFKLQIVRSGSSAQDSPLGEIFVISASRFQIARHL